MRTHHLPALHTALLTALLLVGCATAGTSGPAAPAAPLPEESHEAAAAPTTGDRECAPAAPDDDLNAALWTQRAVEHDLVFREVYRNAEEKLAAALADPSWDALPDEERQGSVDGLAPAVILDIDEAVLDNSPYQARLVRSGDEYNEFTWAQWCKEEKARALPGAVEFTTYAADHGIAVYYISNRAQDLDEATLDNLRKAGLPVAGKDSFLGLGTYVPGCEQIGSDKSCRRLLVGREHRVLMQFGDQIGDFVDVVANTPDGRGRAVDPYLDWIGERWWVLPNPTYGSWEPAQFNNDWSLPRGVRRCKKIEALRVD